jgi:trehalose-6-phosphatase
MPSPLRLLFKGKRPSQMSKDIEQAMIQATEDNANTLAREAKARVHVITGRTRESIKVRMQGPYKGQVLADYGAPFEEERGGDHAFASQAVEAVKPICRRNGEIALGEAING